VRVLDAARWSRVDQSCHLGSLLHEMAPFSSQARQDGAFGVWFAQGGSIWPIDARKFGTGATMHRNCTAAAQIPRPTHAWAVRDPTDGINPPESLGLCLPRGGVVFCFCGLLGPVPQPAATSSSSSRHRRHLFRPAIHFIY